MKIELEPCPFCGADLSEYLETQIIKCEPAKTKGKTGIDYEFEVRCIHCGAGGLKAKSKENAVKLWNARGQKEHENVFNDVLNEETDGKWGEYLKKRDGGVNK